MSEQDGIADLISGLVAAWNAGDAPRFVSLFAPDADYVTAAGRWVRGREEIGRLLESDGNAQVRLEQAPSIRLHGLLGIAVFRWVAQGGAAGSSERRGIISLVALRPTDRWEIALLQNTAA